MYISFGVLKLYNTLWPNISLTDPNRYIYAVFQC